MKKNITPYLILVLLCTGCGLQAREEAVRKKEAALTAREQQLSLREKSLESREAAVLQLQQQLDSVKTKADTALVYNQQLVGSWNVKMTCTETSCVGSAIGDTKVETWNIAYQNNSIVAKAIANDKLVRIYTGSYDGTNVMLSEDVSGAAAEPAAKLTIRLSLSDSNTMEGVREIVRENNCRIVYSLQLNKEKTSSL